MFNVKVLGAGAAMAAIITMANPGQSAIGNSAAADQKLSAVAASTAVLGDSRDETTTTTTKTTTKTTTTTTTGVQVE